jgi:SP family facilitated glucose transporter-like MFS transporter 1
VSFIWACIVSAFCLGGMVGGLSVGTIAASGRKSGMLILNVLVFTGGFLMSTSKIFGHYSLLVAGRLLIGVAAGIAAGLTPIYLIEISPGRVRGAVGTVYQLILTSSILTSEILGLESLLGGERTWPWLLAITVIPGLVQMIFLPCCPESPR